jgi:hypothetical protein
MPKTKPDYSLRFYAWIGATPRHDGPTPMLDAAQHRDRINEAIAMNGRRLPNDTDRYGGAAGALIEWTRDEYRNLLRLRDRWARRAAGNDRRWLVRGEKPGQGGRALADFARPLAPGEQPPPAR